MCLPDSAVRSVHLGFQHHRVGLVAPGGAGDPAGGLVVAGSCSPPALQEAAHRLNAALGNAGRTVFYTDPVPALAEPLAGLVEAMRAGSVSTLILLDVNPSHDAPGGLGFTDALSEVPLRIHAGAYADETSLHCDWHLPLAHMLESWGDFRAVDGTVGLAQPTIAPLHERRTPSEILSLLADAEPRTARDLLRGQWRGGADPAAFAPAWDAMLRNGFVPATALPPQEARLAAAAPADAGTPPTDMLAGTLEVLIRPDPNRAGRPGREQLLAAGAAQAVDQAGLEERPLGFAGLGRAPVA